MTAGLDNLKHIVVYAQAISLNKQNLLLRVRVFLDAALTARFLA